PPGSQSSAARALIVPCRREAVKVQQLNAAQLEQHAYATAMAAYVEWLSKDMRRFERDLPAKRDRLRDRFQQNGHGRLPEAIANLSIGLRAALRFALELEVLTDSDAELISREGADIFRDLASRQERRLVDREPTKRFAVILRDLFVQGKVFLRDRHTGEAP